MIGFWSTGIAKVQIFEITLFIFYKFLNAMVSYVMLEMEAKRK